MAQHATVGRALNELINDVDERVMEQAHGHALPVHAAAVEVDGRVVLLPAASGSGKTTLAAAAVAAGARYVTDECVVIGQNTMQVSPYARPLCIKAGSQAVVRAMLGDDEPPPGDAPSWHVAPSRLGEISHGGRLAAVVVPTYEAGSRTELPPSPGRRRCSPWQSSSRSSRLGPEEALPALRDVVSQGRCASLRFSDVHEAAEALLEVLT